MSPTQIEHAAALSAPLNTSIAGSTGVIELARPETFNCLSLETFAALAAALDQFESSGNGVRSILLRAKGKHFCTGADLTELKDARRNADSLRHFLQAGHAVLNRMQASSLPIVAACQGLCLAGGLELMLSCDVVIADPGARFGDQHGKFGIIPGWGGSQRLPRVIGARRAMDLLLSARWVDAETALQWGLVNYVCAPGQLLDTAQSYCDMLATRSKQGLAEMKRLAREGLDATLAEGLKLEEESALATLQLDDVREGIAAFEARREPVFTA